MVRKVNLFVMAMMMPISALGIEITDYVDPESFYEEARVDATFNLKSGNQDQTSFNGNASGFYEVNYSTLPFTWSIDLEGNLDLDRGSADEDSTEKGYDFLTSGNFDKYFNNTSDLLGYGSLELGYRRPFGADEDDDPYVKLGAGVGYGRVINATPLAKVLRFIEELMDYQVITREPDEQTYLTMASIVSREDEFESRYGHEDYKQYWIGELEKVMQKAGLLKNNTIGAVGVIKMHDVLIDEPISVRKHGWIAKGGIGYVASNYDGSDSDPSLDASFEYALPIGHKFQFIELAKYSTILASDTVHNLTNRMSGTYEVSDRIDWVNFWDLNVTLPTEDDAKDIITNALESSFRYHLTNRFDAVLSVKLTQVEDDVDDNGNDDLDTAVNMGVSYRLK